MARGQFVPITPAVLQWAIDNSDLTLQAFAEKVGVPSEQVDLWLAGKLQPNLTGLADIARALKRPKALFFLPAPPESPSIRVKFRCAHDSQRQQMSAAEVRYVRQADRLQATLEVICSGLGKTPAPLPQSDIGVDVARLASRIRRWLDIPADVQMNEWLTASVALKGWRLALERKNVFVIKKSMGPDAVRGFSLYSDHASIICINSHWRDEARIYTIMHELAHLLTRTPSACLENQRIKHADEEERWCEKFAAICLMPPEALESIVDEVGESRPVSMKTVTRVSRKFKVSMRAAALRLIDLNWADQALYDEILPVKDMKPGGGGGGSQSMTERVVGLFGAAIPRLFREGISKRVVNRADALDYLRVQIDDIEVDS